MAIEVEKIKELIDKQVENGEIMFLGAPFKGVQKAYFTSNENIAGYLKKDDLEGKDKALTVMGSGDQYLSLLANNILDITIFDINKFSEIFGLGIKKALVLKYDYQECLKIYSKIMDNNISLEELTSILIDLLPYMDKEIREVWQIIIDYNYKIQKDNKQVLNLFYLLCINIRKNNLLNDKLMYLKDAETYNNLKNNLNRANLKFLLEDAENLPQVLKEKYDVILFSNILDYFYQKWGFGWNYALLDNYLKDLKNITNEEGLIYLKYIMRYSTPTYKSNILFNSGSVTKNDLENAEILEFPSLVNNINDGMILKKNLIK